MMSSPFDTFPAPRHHRDVTPADVAAHRDHVRIVDVREPHEYSGELGHIAGAELVPLATVIDRSTEWDMAQELVLVSRSGARSGRAAIALAERGFTRTSNMVGGMLRWNEEGRPVQR